MFHEDSLNNHFGIALINGVEVTSNIIKIENCLGTTDVHDDHHYGRTCNGQKIA